MLRQAKGRQGKWKGKARQGIHEMPKINKARIWTMARTNTRQNKDKAREILLMFIGKNRPLAPHTGAGTCSAEILN
jgi:hypothetical protein